MTYLRTKIIWLYFHNFTFFLLIFTFSLSARQILHAIIILSFFIYFIPTRQHIFCYFIIWFAEILYSLAFNNIYAILSSSILWIIFSMDLCFSFVYYNMESHPLHRVFFCDLVGCFSGWENILMLRDIFTFLTLPGLWDFEHHFFFDVEYNFSSWFYFKIIKYNCVEM